MPSKRLWGGLPEQGSIACGAGMLKCMILGVISDTHGLLRPEAEIALASVDVILHAGDVGDIRILEQLRYLAPVHAIRGNVDTHGPCAALPETEMLLFGDTTLYMLHSIQDLDLNPRAAGIDLVLSGHSHQPSIETRDRVLYLNPGSAGPRRFKLPITVARVRITDTLQAEILPLLP